MFYSIGDTVTYGIHGVCRITKIENKEFMGVSNNYYVLEPIYDPRSTVFVPTENDVLMAKMKRIMSASEIYELINQMPNEADIWIDNDTDRKRRYSEIIKSGDRYALVRLIKTLYIHKE